MAAPACVSSARAYSPTTSFKSEGLTLGAALSPPSQWPLMKFLNMMHLALDTQQSALCQPSSADRKLIKSGLPVDFSGSQHSGWKARLVRRIREVLCLQAEAGMAVEYPAGGANDAAVQEIARIKL